MKKRTLILKSESDSFEKYYSQKMKSENIDVFSIYKFNSGLLRSLTILWIQVFHFPFKSMWYGNWKKIVTQYDRIIVFDRLYGYDILEYIHRKNGKARLIFWYWNIAQNMIPDKYRKYCEVWSFDGDDCKKYNFRKNVQFYFQPESSNNVINYDAVFIGRDKGRYEQIKRLYDYLNEKNLKLNFNVLDSEHKEGICIDKAIDYEEVIKLIESSRCVVEFTQKDQTGLSARALEALFYKKKLVTNNKAIRYEKIYSKDNVFILEEDNIEELVKFISEPYVVSEKDFEKEYTYETWIKNFE